MKAALVRLLESTKAWTLVIGLTATFLAKYGVHVDDSTAQMIAAGFALLLGAQAATDHGKAAALIQERMALSARAAASSNVPAAQVVPPASQAGFVRVSVMLFVVLTAVTSMAFTDGCHPTPAPVQDIINCTLQDQGQLSQLEAKCAALVPDWAAVEGCAIAALPSVGYQIGSCVIADIVQQYLVKKGAIAPVTDTWTAKGMLEDWRAKYGKGATIQTADGKL